MDDRRFPILPRPLLPTERARLKRKADTWSVKPNNGEALGLVFERLVQAFEFEWAWDVFDRISRHDQRTGKFTGNLTTVGEIVGQHMPIDRINQIYLVIEDCLRERWTLQSAVLPVSCGFAKRPDSIAWIPVLRRLAQLIDLDEQIDGALGLMVPFDNAKCFPFTTEEFLGSLIDTLGDQIRKEKWTAAMEDRRTARDDHESRLDLIHEAVQVARGSQHPSGAFAEATRSLITLNECSHLQSLLREVLTFSEAELDSFIHLFGNTLDTHLRMLNHAGALRAFVDCCLALFRTDARPDWITASLYHDLAEAALRLGLLGWWLECTERYIEAFTRSGDLDSLARQLLWVADEMKYETMAHCPNEFWRSFADLMPTPELKSTILSKVAVRI